MGKSINSVKIFISQICKSAEKRGGETREKGSWKFVEIKLKLTHPFNTLRAASRFLMKVNCWIIPILASSIELQP